MRLLNVKTLRLSSFDDDDYNIPKYAIASHRWVADEATFDDVKRKRNTETAGYRKVVDFCSFMRDWSPHIEWLWIDTCCIDKKSSAELSEAINSMFRWYANAEICFAYLADVAPATSAGGIDAVYRDFKSTVWFTRGWTLQELLASKTVVFLTRDWMAFGNKGADTIQDIVSLNLSIVDITGIPYSVLLDYDNSRNCSDDQKWTWVEGRTTTKEEDLAYCLLGIFGINMPLIYGEGAQARVRLRDEIRAKKRRMRERQKRMARFSSLSISTMAAHDEMYAEQVNHDANSRPEYELPVEDPIEEPPTRRFKEKVVSQPPSNQHHANIDEYYSDEEIQESWSSDQETAHISPVPAPTKTSTKPRLPRKSLAFTLPGTPIPIRGRESNEEAKKTKTRPTGISQKPPKSALKKPTVKFPEDPVFVREGVARRGDVRSLHPSSKEATHHSRRQRTPTFHQELDGPRLIVFSSTPKFSRPLENASRNVRTVSSYSGY